MKKLKFHLYRDKNGKNESFCIGGVETINKYIADHLLDRATYRLYTINSSGIEYECWEGTILSVERFIETIVVPLEQLVAKREQVQKNIEKVTETLFGETKKE